MTVGDWSAASLVASASFIVLVLLAHVFNAEISPRWRMLSELSLGRHGWLMKAAFVAWSASNVLLSVALWRSANVWGALALLVVSVGPFGAAFADADPITSPSGAATRHASWHAVFGLLFIFGLPLVTVILAVESYGQKLFPVVAGLALLVCAAIILFLAVVARWRRSGIGFGPQLPIGIPNRIFAAADVAWTIGVALALWLNPSAT